MSLAKPWQLTGGRVYVISGSRLIRNYWLFARFMRDLLKDRSKEDTILLQGDAHFGVDRLARIFAKRDGWRGVGWPANWDVEGRKAGHVRNASMLENADELFAFWDGESKGTKNAVDTGKRKGIPTTLIVIEPIADAEDRNIESIVKYRRLGDRARSKLQIRG